MIVQPKSLDIDGTPVLIVHPSEGHGVYIAARVISPKGMAGRGAVDLHVPAELVVPLLKVLRQAAANQRSTPMTEAP